MAFVGKAAAQQELMQEAEKQAIDNKIVDVQQDLLSRQLGAAKAPIEVIENAEKPNLSLTRTETHSRSRRLLPVENRRAVSSALAFSAVGR